MTKPSGHAAGWERWERPPTLIDIASEAIGAIAYNVASLISAAWQRLGRVR